MSAHHDDSIARILDLAAKARRQELNQAIHAATKGRVSAGPFEGMVLPDRKAWLDGDIAPKLLGFYEAELHALWRQVASTHYSLVINVGCAEGYYAIGLARLMPGATVCAFDTSKESQLICHEAATRNGVADRVVVGGRCDCAVLQRLLRPELPAFLILDCEGAEKELLDPEKVPALRGCDFVAECHDFYDREITATLLRRFSLTHELTVIREGPRDPNAIPLLNSLNSLDRWLTVCEFRPETMGWLAGMRKKVSRGGDPPFSVTAMSPLS